MSKQTIDAQKQAGTGGQFGELDKATNTVNLDERPRSWSQQPRIAGLLGDGEPLTEREEDILAILIDPELNEYDDLDAEGLAEQFSYYEGFDRESVCSLADRLRLHHEKEQDDPNCWVFEYSNYEGDSWYEVGSALPGTDLSVTRGDDGKYLSGRRYDLDGLRAAINAAVTIDDTWLSARQQMRELGLLRGAGGSTGGMEQVADRAHHTLADLDNTDDSADWVQAGHVLDEREVEWLRSLKIVS